MTETLETVTDNLGNEHQTVLEMQAQMSQLQQTIDGLTVQVTNQYAGGLNFIQNSAGLNGISDDWVKTGTVTVDTSTDTQNNTTSDSCFVTYFDEALFENTVDRIKVLSRREIAFELKCGLTLKERI